ncbi:MAG TPA: hypothetical protein VJ895_01065 [Candidatus Nanoarchaeia archaeon]|nr:hypothetical protein [Candidatus Nanoarchaeia archaeon]
MEEIEKNLEGKWVEIQFVNQNGEAVSMGGKLNYIRLDGQDYSYFRMNPTIGMKENEYDLIKVPENPLYVIPPGCLQQINDKLTKKDLERKCQEYSQNLKILEKKPVGFGRKEPK